MNPVHPSASTPIRVFLICRSPILRVGLRKLLSGRNRLGIAGEAADLGSVPHNGAASPDIFLIEPEGDDPSCLAGLPRLLAAFSGSRAILLVPRGQKQWESWGLRMGAFGVVGALEPPESLVRAIRQVHSGQLWISPATVVETLDRLAGQSKGRRVKALSGVSALTAREAEVIRLVGQALSNKQIGERLFISSITVRHHLTSIFAKLGLTSRLELAQFAFRHGFADLPGNCPEASAALLPRPASRRQGAA